MTWFKGDSKIDHQKAKDYLNKLIASGHDFEIKKKLNKRTYSQNNYIHLLFGYFALSTGYTPEEVKQDIFKKIVNPEMFYEGEKENMPGIKIEQWRSTVDLNTKEMSICTERFLDWSAHEAGIRLPEPSDLAFLKEIEIELANNPELLK